ncbi:MAG TPA: HIT family protein [Candidatus Saccharibacteria bacterium]|jgi:diadenosine tetraphosphate (Ap4A) HIT family hydrolase|nr:HIT family protein [Candidatus Saccharibacteria bacterium]HMR38433.1 HIT family protein [Candidatus Saccharibacteria bacterium]
MNETMQTFGYPGTLVKEYEHWVMLLKPKQTTVGTLVLVEKSEATHLGELSRESWAEFADVSRDAEAWTRQAFGAEKFNYLALMMKDPNVHFHFVPRYSQPVEVGGESFADTDWPSKTELGNIELNEAQLNEIRTKLQSVQ